MRRALVEGALRVQRSTTLSLLESLEPAQWDVPCLPPWRVREVVAHLITVDQASVTARMLPMLRPGGRAGVERWNDRVVRRWADRPPDELLAGLTRWGQRLARTTKALPGPLLKLPIGLYHGQMNLGATLLHRVVDEWVHTVDIARVTDRLAPATVPVPAALARGCLSRLPGGALPQVGRRVGVARLEVDVGSFGGGGVVPGSGPWERWGVDFARKHFGPQVGARPDATIRLHATALALLVEARADWRDPAVGVEVEGDQELAAAILDVLGATAVVDVDPA